MPALSIPRHAPSFKLFLPQTLSSTLEASFLHRSHSPYWLPCSARRDFLVNEERKEADANDEDDAEDDHRTRILGRPAASDEHGVSGVQWNCRHDGGCKGYISFNSSRDYQQVQD